MYNPHPYLPERFRKAVDFLRNRKIPPKLIFLTLGFLATLWFLIRVIPKPSRAGYPCMRATAPLMSGFVLYLLGMAASAATFRKYLRFRDQSRPLLAWFFLFLAIGISFFTVSTNIFNGFASRPFVQKGVFPPNVPIGEAKGIFPGRVVWMWDPTATNRQCTNTSNNNGFIDPGDDAWFMAANNNPAVIDSMVVRSLRALTGKNEMPQVWDTLFRYYNFLHGNGNNGYNTGERIFLKINSTSAYGGLADGRFNADLGRTDHLTVNAFVSEINPYVVLAVLRQLVHQAGVPENMIYVGDPARNIYKECYELWHDQFPGIHVLGNNLIHPEIPVLALDRTPVSVTATNRVFFSDHGTAMPEAIEDKLFTVFDSMSYLINIPAMKAHGTAGITLAAKNHFGSFTRDWAMHLHPGLMDSVDFPKRTGYGLYRVQTDIMMHKLLSGKNLLIVIDGTWPGEDALGVPEKWEMAPFNHDWCSSLFMSLDPVAVESVCHDFLRTEYNGQTLAECRPNWDGVDDYLHQAADSSLWPAGIEYDPDNDGIIFASLGVHEHWNDSARMQYTRNLGSGSGIELYKAHEIHSGLNESKQYETLTMFPNPTDGPVYLRVDRYEGGIAHLAVYDQSGKRVYDELIPISPLMAISVADQPSGIYLVEVKVKERLLTGKIIRR